VAAEDQLKRIDIRAPQSGIVHQLSVHTIGGVIDAGAQIMLIVPEPTKLVIEARVAPRDIDQVKASSEVNVRFPAFSMRTTPEFKGVVSRVSADLTRDEQAGQAGQTSQSYYVARIVLAETEQDKLGDLRLSLIPGMPAEVQIKTQERTVLSYLLKPLQDQVALTFKDR
jgi:HlyD family secretion protein